MSFPGESIPLEVANAISGTVASFGAPMRFRAGSDTFTAGDSFLAGFFEFGPIEDYPDADVAASVVLVFGLATAGTVRVSYGVDPGFDVTNPALATHPLGTHVVGGVSQLVLPIASFDVAALLDYEHEQLVFVEVLDGTVEVAQIKLRLWPPAGISGAWVPGESYTFPVGAITVHSEDAASGPGVGEASTVEDAYAAAVAQWNTRGPIRALTGNARSQGSVRLFYNDVSYSARVSLSVAALWIQATSVGETVDTSETGFIHPDEVPGEPGSAARNLDGTPAVYEFAGWSSGEVVLSSSIGFRTVDGTPVGPIPPTASGAVSVEAGAAMPNLWSVAGQMVTDRYGPPAGGTGVPPGTTHDVETDSVIIPMPDSPSVAFKVASYPWFSRPLDNYYEFELGGFEYESSQVDRIRVRDLAPLARVPAHLVWDPTADPEPAPLRQVQRDDNANGFSAARWGGGSSRAASNRWIGYV